MNLDVTPVGGEPGARASSGPSAGGDRPDPFGSRPSVRRRGWIRILLGAVVMTAGTAATVAGIVGAVRANPTPADAVARGEVTNDAPGQAVRFTNDGPDRASYTVYLLFDGIELISSRRELAVRDTGCVATMPDGVQTAFRGARQGTAVVIEDAESVGHFSSQPGAVTIRCAYTSSTRSSRRLRPDRVPYIVTPGKPGAIAGAVLLIVGGVSAELLGGWALWSGWRGRRRPR